MYPFDHIRRNWDKRLSLHREAERLLKKANQEMDEAIEIEDDDDYDARMEEINATTMARFNEIYATERALCYPEPRNDWFKNFVASFADGITCISEKQYNVFGRYCESDNDTWTTGSRYCRIGDRFITLTWKNSNRSVKITRFNPNISITE
jgi:hypothetical protein